MENRAEGEQMCRHRTKRFKRVKTGCDLDLRSDVALELRSEVSFIV